MDDLGREGRGEEDGKKMRDGKATYWNDRTGVNWGVANDHTGTTAAKGGNNSSSWASLLV